jgi:ABC-type multidrug transport system fused ATPase/permease subunit
VSTGEQQDARANAPSALGLARRAALDHLAKLLKIAPKPAWATPALVALGLAASFAETLGITLIILFFYLAMGQADGAASLGGILGQVLSQASSWFTSSTELASVILLLIVARGALAFGNAMITAYVSERISEKARNLIHEQYLTVSYSFIQRHEQAQLMEVLGTESWQIASAYGSLTRILICATSIVVFTFFLFALSWQITLTAIVGSVLISLGLRRLSKPAQALGVRVKRVHQKLGEHMLMTLEGLRTIRAYGQEEVHQKRFISSSAEARHTVIALTRLSALLNPLTEVGYLAILCVIIAASTYWGTSFATTLAAVALLYRVQPYTREIEGNLLYLAQIEPQLRSVRAMLEQEDKQYPSPGYRPITSLRKSIRFEHVTFQHEPGAKPALKDVTFEIPAGVTTALVGASGAGKTTVINLLLRLYQPSSGRVWVDDVALDELRRSDWLSLLAVAGQDVELVEGTVIDNIRMANKDATDEEVVAASRIAGVSEFIESLEGGYETWIGQQGLRFSGGERQRLGLARAILRDPQFLMLDEAMSALDQELEARIRHAIEQRFAGRTLLIITHRLETVRNADHVIHIDAGRVMSQAMGAVREGEKAALVERGRTP